jgi:cyclophilin family peptidyl-prolyl cis-trans isomerase
MKILKFVGIIGLILLYSCQAEDAKYKDLSDGLYVDIQTNNGDILLSLDYENAPITVGNFVSLAEGTNMRVTDSLIDKPFYDGMIFHRVISKANGDSNDFMLQGGDPMRNGTGGPGYKFVDEFPADSLGGLLLRHDKPGILSMANSGPSANGSQFFITLSPQHHLDGKHSVFGKVVEGQDVVNSTKVNTVMNKVVIVRKGSSANNFNAFKVFDKQFQELDDRKGKFLSKMQKYKSEAKELSSGLKIYFEEKGEGPKPNIGSSILIHYAAYFTNGELLATNYKDVAKEYLKFNPKASYEPFPNVYSMEAQLVQGFKEGLQEMYYGDKAILFIPYHLAYGEFGGSGVPPKTDLIFELEMYPKSK